MAVADALSCHASCAIATVGAMQRMARSLGKWFDFNGFDKSGTRLRVFNGIPIYLFKHKN